MPKVSYHNQTDIMHKIFGNEQNFKKVKNLFNNSHYAQTKPMDYSYNIPNEALQKEEEQSYPSPYFQNKNQNRARSGIPNASSAILKDQD